MSTDKERQAVRKFLFKGLALSLPFVVLAAAIVVIDPFSYFGLFQFVDERVKKETSGRLHYTLWKVIEYNKKPLPNLLLGDSRINGFPVDEIERVSGTRFFNFGYAGGTLPEMIDTFWFAAERVNLRQVCIAIGFANANSFQNMNRVPESKAILANPALYLTNRIVFKSALYNLKAAWDGVAPDIESPLDTTEEFWRMQLGPTTTALYGNYQYPQEYVDDLREIGKHCHEVNIKLWFLIPPTHVDLQRKVSEFGLDAENERFLADLRTIAPVIDLDFPNEYTSERTNFTDPYHAGSKTRIINAIWGSGDSILIRRFDYEPIKSTDPKSSGGNKITRSSH